MTQRHTSATGKILGLLLVAGLILIFDTTSADATGGGLLGTDVPAGGGMVLAVWSGGVVESLDAAADSVGCSLESAWTTVNGNFVSYIAEAPAFVNQAFTSHFVDTIPSGTVLLLNCSAASTGSAGATPIPTPTPTPTPTPAPTPTPQFLAVEPYLIWITNAATSGWVSTTGESIVPARIDCSMDAKSLGWGWLEGAAVVVEAQGTGRCAGWYRAVNADGERHWIPAGHASGIPVSVPPTPTPTPSPTPAPANAPLSVFTIDGRAYLVASDGTYLGVVSSNRYASDSICNRYGSFGSKYASDSVRNRFGSYGSPYASASAYNPYTSSPPRIVYNGSVIGYLSKNSFLSGAIDPDVLFALYDCVHD